MLSQSDISLALWAIITCILDVVHTCIVRPHLDYGMRALQAATSLLQTSWVKVVVQYRFSLLARSTRRVFSPADNAIAYIQFVDVCIVIAYVEVHEYESAISPIFGGEYMYHWVRSVHLHESCYMYVLFEVAGCVCMVEFRMRISTRLSPALKCSFPECSSPESSTKHVRRQCKKCSSRV